VAIDENVSDAVKYVRFEVIFDDIAGGSRQSHEHVAACPPMLIRIGVCYAPGQFKPGEDAQWSAHG